ncbi:unnamed protein product [Angiostrongylus costaricensis]|uniref:Uncharacterized protein n=1 Tax=Angiostrongylus costaricensis TaxID=334426 RepID=A0A158PH89_ANGCS|nr:unnamed protein product [Angiostrongylus costaricensis]
MISKSVLINIFAKESVVINLSLFSVVDGRFPPWTIMALIYVGKTDEDLCKAIQIIEELERRIGGSTGELAAFKKSLDEIRCDIAATQTTVHEKH